MHRTPEQRCLLDIVVKTCEWLLSVLNVAWVVFLFFFVLMNIADFVATRFGCRFSRCKSQAVPPPAWTAEITMILPVTLIVILTSAFWKILIELLPRVSGSSHSTRFIFRRRMCQVGSRSPSGYRGSTKLVENRSA